MTAHTSRDSLKFELPNMLSYHTTWDDADYAPQLPLPRRGPFARLVDALGAGLQTALARRTESSELAAMSDSELADIGINRNDVSRLFDPELAHEYKSRRGLSAGHRPCAEAPGRFARH